MVGFDLKSPINSGCETFTDLLKGPANVRRTNSLLTTVRLSASKTIRQMCSPISRQPSNKNLFMFRPIPVHDFCPDNLSTESSGHRDLFKSDAVKALPLRNTRQCFTQHFSKCKRASKLENIRRFCTGLNKQSSNTLRQRRLRSSAESRSLCSGFNHHRFMSVTFSMGKISQTQGCGQGTYTDGLKRLYTHVYPHYRRKSPRCKYSRLPGLGAWGDLCNGPRIPRLRSSFHLYSKSFHFRHKTQKQFQLSSALLSQGRQSNRFAMRPNNKTQRFLCIAGLPCGSSPHRLFRYRNKQKVHLPDEQLFTGRSDNHPTLQMPLANRNIFQMDQAVPANQNIFRHQHQRSENANLDCYQRLCSGSYCQERTRNHAEFRRNPANPQHCTFRESLYHASTYENYVAKRKYSVS